MNTKKHCQLSPTMFMLESHPFWSYEVEPCRHLAEIARKEQQTDNNHDDAADFRDDS